MSANKPLILEIPKSPFQRKVYNSLNDKSLSCSPRRENVDELKDETPITLSPHIHAQPQTQKIQNIELATLHSLGNDMEIDSSKRRLDSVAEEVKELLTPDRQLKMRLDHSSSVDSKRKRTFMSISALKEERMNVLYNMSPSMADNTLILKPEIQVHGMNLSTGEKSPANYEWLMKQDRSSLRGFQSMIIRTHLKLLKVNSRLHISILQIIKSIIFVIVDALQAILSIFSCILYILDCYNTEKDEVILHFLHNAELAITIIFTFDLLRHFLEAKHKLRFFLKRHTIIDIIAIIPYYISKIVPLENSLNFLHILQIFKLIRILRLYRLFNDPDLDSEDLFEARFSLEKQIAVLVCTIFATLFILSGLSFELNGMLNETYKITDQDASGETVETRNTDDYTFFLAFYMLFQTFLTLGYGDVVPCTASSRLFIIVVIFCFAVLLVNQGYKLWEVKSKISPYDFEYKNRGHYLIIGFFNEGSVQRMLGELFRGEEECISERETLVLLVRDCPPSAEMMNLIDKVNSFRNENSVAYLQCSFMKEDILTKANVRYAKAIFLMNDPNLRSRDNEILMLLALFQDSNAFVRKIVQVNHARNRSLSWKPSPLSNPWNFAFSPKRLKIALIAGSAFNKGIIPLFNNLLIASSSFIPQIKTRVECQWLMEYSSSSMQSVFLVRLSDYFFGKTFAETVRIIYRSKSSRDNVKGTLIIGVKTFKNIENNKGNVHINPQNYRIKPGDQAIVIAKSQETVGFLSYFIEELDLKDSGLPGNHPLFQLERCGVEFIDELNEQLLLKKSSENEYYCEKLKRHIPLWSTDVSLKLRGHIIVFAEEESFPEILEEIRTRTEKPVCFFIDHPPDPRILDSIARFPRAFVFEGDLLSLEHLKHANMAETYHVLIFCQPSDGLAENIDSKAILLANILEEYFSVPYTLEISNLSEMRLLGMNPKKEFASLGFNFNPHFMAGNVLPSSFADSLSVYLAESDILLDLMKHCFQEERTASEVIENHRVFSISCPASYCGRRYEDLVVKCLSMKNSMIPIGILTRKFSKFDLNTLKTVRETQFKSVYMNTAGPGSSPTRRLNQLFNEDRDPRNLRLPLFLLNPLPTTVLDKEDILLIFGDASKEKPSMHEFPMNYSLFEEEVRALKEKTSEMFGEIVESLKGKMLNREVFEELARQKNEMIEKMEGLIDQKREILREMAEEAGEQVGTESELASSQKTI